MPMVAITNKGTTSTAVVDVPTVTTDMSTTSPCPTTSTTDNQVAEMLKFLRESATSAIDNTTTFVSREAPLTVKEIITFERANTTVQYGAILAVALVCAGLLYRNGARWIKEADSNYCSYESPVKVVATSVLLIISSIATFVCTQDFLRVWFAPRLVILDYLRHFVR